MKTARLLLKNRFAMVLFGLLVLLLVTACGPVADPARSQRISDCLRRCEQSGGPHGPQPLDGDYHANSLGRDTRTACERECHGL